MKIAMNLIRFRLLFLRRFIYIFLGFLNNFLTPRKQIIILCYHSISDDSWRYSVSLNEFKRQITFIDENFKSITIQELKNYLIKKTKIPDKCYLLTFDDGYQDILSAKDFLETKNIKPLLFILSDTNDSNHTQLATDRPFLNSTQIQLLKKTGWSIGSHSRTHTDFSKLSNKELLDEILNSKKTLERNLKIRIDYFAYPKGVYNKAILNVVKEAGYKMAFSMDDANITSKTNLLTMPRVGVDGSHSISEFQNLYLPLNILFRGLMKWCSKFLVYFLKVMNFKKNILKKLISLPALTITGLTFLIIGLLLLSTLRGLPGNPGPKELIANSWQEKGPFELSPERGRFALTYSLVEHKSLNFNTDLARFATPDLGSVNGHYVSLFAPGVSFIIIPGYIVGRILGNSQVGAFAIIGIFALINSYLIFKIAKTLGASIISSVIAGFSFIVATPALTYGSTLYQHHISTFIILSSIFLLIRFNSLLSLFLVTFLVALSIPVDYPNLFLCFPIAVYAISKVFEIKKAKLGTGENNFLLSFRPVRLIALLGLIIPLTFFLWFNYASYGNPFQLSGTVASVRAIDVNGKPSIPKDTSIDDFQLLLNPDLQTKSLANFFRTRNLLQGFYIHAMSPDRGFINFTPIIVFSLVGFLILYKKQPSVTAVLISVLGINLLLYSMWDDPWGGWAFGSRYLIPSYAIAAIGLPFLLNKFSKNIFILITFFILINYSAYINLLGAITSSSNPPQTEILGIEKVSHKQERYSYDRNIEYLLTKGSKSFLYQSVIQKFLTSLQFYLILALVVTIWCSLLTIRLIKEKGINYERN